MIRIIDDRYGRPVEIEIDEPKPEERESETDRKQQALLIDHLMKRIYEPPIGWPEYRSPRRRRKKAKVEE